MSYWLEQSRQICSGAEDSASGSMVRNSAARAGIFLLTARHSPGMLFMKKFCIACTEERIPCNQQIAIVWNSALRVRRNDCPKNEYCFFIRQSCPAFAVSFFCIAPGIGLCRIKIYSCSGNSLNIII